MVCGISFLKTNPNGFQDGEFIQLHIIKTSVNHGSKLLPKIALDYNLCFDESFGLRISELESPKSTIFPSDFSFTASAISSDCINGLGLCSKNTSK
jgi:hypothetical protein